MRYEINKREIDGFLIYQFRDNETDTECELLPEIGSNLISFKHQGNSYISEFPDIKQMVDRVTCYQYGCATLFPPNRIKNATFDFKERTYILPRNEMENHLHGDLCYKQWLVVDCVVENDSCCLTTEFRIADHADMMQYYPHELVFQFSYSLQKGELKINGSVRNEGKNEAPFALGFHPYFKLYKGLEDQIELKVPAIEEWGVDTNAFVNKSPEKTTFISDINKGKRLGHLQPLDVWLVALDKDKQVECEINYLNIQTKLLFSIDTTILPYLVIFKPDWNDSISLEPYSYVTDAFNLPYNYEKTGARGIEANENITFNISLKVH